ncbi:MAG: sugar phosphate nucleotidyltransferase, partial [Acholeplasmataceae bacterium]
SGDHIYKMNYKKMIESHIKNGANLTIATQKVPMNEANRFGIIEPDENLKVIGFEEKPSNPKSNQASMGIYVFDAETLYTALNNITDPNLDFGKHIIPTLIKDSNINVYAYEFEGYWKDVGTYDSYLETSIDLLNTKAKVKLDLYEEDWRIYTRSEEMPPVKVGENANIVNSLISNGCVIEGTVINSVLSPGVYVGPGAVVKNCVVFTNATIKENAHIEKSILDKKVVVGKNAIIGASNDYTPNKEKPSVLNSGINVIAKHAVIPDNITIRRNCRIFRHAKFDTNIVESGSTIK